VAAFLLSETLTELHSHRNDYVLGLSCKLHVHYIYNQFQSHII